MHLSRAAIVAVVPAAALLVYVSIVPGAEDNTPPREQAIHSDGPPGHAEIPDQPPASKPPQPSTAVVPRTGPIIYGPYVSVQVNVDQFGNNIPGDAANEPSIAIDPTNPDRMAIGWRQFDTIASNFRQAGWSHSNDGGQTWNFSGVLEPGEFSSDPVLSYDLDGNFYYYSLQPDRGPGDWGCYLYKSSDSGVTWPQETFAFGGDKAWMVVDRTGGPGSGNVYAIWQRFFNCCDDQTFTRSVDGGGMFHTPVHIPSSPTFGTIAVGPDGEVYAAGIEAINYQNFWAFVVAKSTDARDPWVTPTFVTTTVEMNGRLSFTAAPNPAGLLGQVWVAVNHSSGPTRGCVYVLASIDPPGPDPLDVHFIRSSDGGLTWSPPLRINDDPTDTNAWQWFGTMSVAPNGRIDAVWNDTRNTNLSYLSQLFYAYSTDTGVTWSQNIQVSPVFDSHLGFPQQNKIGDYYHTISDDWGVSVAYAATFNGEQDVYYLHIRLDCNDNDMLDVCDVSCGESGGECDLLGCGEAEDCNQNNVPDECDVSFGTSPDCQLNGIPDECEFADCNLNCVPDEQDIANETSLDCNDNIIPDECEPDCNENQIADECDIRDGTSYDCVGPPSDCFIPHDTPGCDSPDTEECVCQGDFSCCSKRWDSICVRLASLRDCPTCPGRQIPNGIPDECECELDYEQPHIVHSSGLPGKTRPYSGYIDPRIPTDDGLNHNQGLTEVTLVFSEPVFSIGGGDVGPDDFVISQTGLESPPGVIRFESLDNRRSIYRIVLDRIISLQEWTTIQAVVEDQCGNSILDFGESGEEDNEPDRIDIGSLPADINQDRIVTEADLIDLRRFLTSGDHPNHFGLDGDYFDIDRDGVMPEPQDLIRFRQLMTGQAGCTGWNCGWSQEQMHHPRP